MSTPATASRFIPSVVDQPSCRCPSQRTLTPPSARRAPGATLHWLHWLQVDSMFPRILSGTWEPEGVKKRVDGAGGVACDATVTAPVLFVSTATHCNAVGACSHSTSWLYVCSMFFLPSAAGAGTCSWSGLGVVGCTSTCTTWIRYTYSCKHELGHNTGMNHASTDLNNDGGACTRYCY